MADYEVRFSALGRYAPHIFDNPRRKFKKFLDDLRSNIKRYVATNDPETFTRTLRVAHITKIENNKLMSKQKSVGKRSWSISNHHQKDK